MTAKPSTLGRMVNGFDPAAPSDMDERTRDDIARRQKLLGPAYRLFYRTPVQVDHGRGVHLYDRDNNEYLDAYNNVASVGHANPYVTDAIMAQAQRLCTHTRYLQDGILDYAADLLPSFGGRIASDGHMMFTCTGSEANDLAMQIAMHHTGNRGIIITSEAYHGNSYLTSRFSPSLGEGAPLGTWVRRVSSPDSYRIPPDEIAARMVREVTAQIEDLQRRGEGLAAFIADSVFSSDGIYTTPVDILPQVARVVHAAGGIMIADEVQSGFARTGERFWGYQRHGLDPDIVTLGKPMGNGYPVAGLAVAHDVVAAFGRDRRYFNTFGGNSVAIAAARATLDFIRAEGLEDNARDVGAFMRQELKNIMTGAPCIGDVRGAGLYIGVEIVQQGTTRADPATAARIVNALRERRILISATGHDANILKIRPPLIFSRDDAQRLCDALHAIVKDGRQA